MELLEIMKNRSSVRKYTGKKASDEAITQILHSALLVPSGKAKFPCEFIVVSQREILDKLMLCRTGSANMLKDASHAIVVLADSEISDTWIEDGSICMAHMHLMASSLGLGSCWIQLRGREAQNAQSSEEFLREILKFPSNFSALAILSIGVIDAKPAPKSLDDLKVQKIHNERF